MNEEKLNESASRLSGSLGMNEGLAKDLVEDAVALILDYTNQKEMNDHLWVYARQLATIAYNQEGNEGETSRSEGGVSQSFVADIPATIQRGLNRYRIGEVVSYYAPEKS